MHLFEDLVIPEVVDDLYRPVPPGQTGDRLLVTVLSSRTIPLIRYEITDRVRRSVGSASSGGPPCTGSLVPRRCWFPSSPRCLRAPT